MRSVADHAFHRQHVLSLCSLIPKLAHNNRAIHPPIRNNIRGTIIVYLYTSLTKNLSRPRILISQYRSSQNKYRCQREEDDNEDEEGFRESRDWHHLKGIVKLGGVSNLSLINYNLVCVRSSRICSHVA